jgi:circadian clock protein KaiC
VAQAHTVLWGKIDERQTVVIARAQERETQAMQSPESGSAILRTGSDTLDHILGGGIPRQHSIIVTGAPGSGKTLLTSQIAFAHAQAGGRVVIASVTSESNDKLVFELRAFSFFDADKVGDDVFLLNAYPWVKKGPKETREIILSTVRDRGATLFILDGMRAIRDVWNRESDLRDFLYELNIGLLAHRCTGIFTAEYALPTLMQLPEATTLDGIIALSTTAAGQRRYRRIEVVKLRGRPHLLGDHHVHIDHHGVHVIPRLESQPPRETDATPVTERATLDLPELDQALGGGLPRRSSTLLAGSTGVGKTLTALHFAAAGARRGEPCLFLSCYEQPAMLIGRAAGIGLELRQLVEAGHLTLQHLPPAEFEADQIIDDCLAQLRRRGARRLVIDGLGELEAAVIDPDRLARLLASFSLHLREADVTSIMIKEVPKLVGVDVDFSATPLAVTAENVIFERHVELHGVVRRVLSVLKMRESGYDDAVREFVIGPGGLRVLSKIRAEGALTGVGRPLPEEPREPR